MFYVLTFVAGAFLRTLVDAHQERRRKQRVRVWKVIAEGPARPPLSEVLRLQGVYDQPEV